MSKPEEMGMVLWKPEGDSNKPSFLQNVRAEGYDEVQTRRLTSIYQLAQGLSDAVQEGRVKIGHFFETQEQKDLGPERVIVIFKTRRVRQLRVNNGKTVACKAYKLDSRGFGSGVCRLFNRENIPTDYFEKWGLARDVVENNRVINISCADCYFGNWRTENGKSIGPECKLVYELYFLDVTDALNGGNFDKIPHRFDIVEANRPARDARQNLDELITKRLKFQGVPLWAGFFKMTSQRVENKDNQKFHVPRFEFLGLMNEQARPIFELAKLYHEELLARQEEFDKAETEANRESEPVPSDTPETAAKVQDSGLSTPWSDMASGDAGTTPWS